MKLGNFLLLLALFTVGALILLVPTLPAGAPAPEAAGTPWSVDASYIEACSCHSFCPCYFNKEAEHPYCQFQMAVRVNDGNVGNVQLKGTRYWLAGDLGDHWGKDNQFPWLVVTFDPSVTKEQRDALVKVLLKLYPQPQKVDMDEAKISWSIREGVARASLANGKGEMVLERTAGADGGSVVLHNVKYWSASSNRGFVVYKSKVNRWDGFGQKFSHPERNAFTIRIQASGTL